MEIHLKHIIPLPLKESLKTGSSEIWNQDNLVIKSNDSILIHAPSGKGKSTLLNILFGLRTDYDGELIIDNELFTGTASSNWDKIRREAISMVFQGLQLFDHLTAVENIQLKNTLTNHKTPAEIKEMLAALDISSLANQKAETLSFGQKQRVAIVRALCQPFNLLLLDEPFSHLDEVNSSKALDLLMAEASKTSAGVIITSLGDLSSSHFTKSLSL